MTSQESRNELREHLVAAMEAAPELRSEDRHHLADVFLDRLDEDFDLVPRGAGAKPRSADAGGAPPWWTTRWAKVAMVAAIVLFVIPAAFHHFPIFLLGALVVFFVMRRSRRWSGTAFR